MTEESDDTINAQVMKALSRLPGFDNIARDDLDFMTAQIIDGANEGRYQIEAEKKDRDDLDLLRSKLKRLLKTCKDGIHLIESVRETAAGELFPSTFDPDACKEHFIEMGDSAIRALGIMRSPQRRSGRPGKLSAEYATIEAAYAYQVVTRRVPTVSNDPIGGSTRGEWCGFLQDIFSALALDTSNSVNYWAKWATNADQRKEIGAPTDASDSHDWIAAKYGF